MTQEHTISCLHVAVTSTALWAVFQGWYEHDGDTLCALFVIGLVIQVELAQRYELLVLWGASQVLMLSITAVRKQRLGAKNEH